MHPCYSKLHAVFRVQGAVGIKAWYNCEWHLHRICDFLQRSQIPSKHAGRAENMPKTDRAAWTTAPTCSAAWASAGCWTVRAGTPGLKMPAFSLAISCSRQGPGLLHQQEQLAVHQPEDDAFLPARESPRNSSLAYWQCVTQDLHVIKAQRGDACDDRAGDTIGGVQPPPQPNLQNGHIHILLQKYAQPCRSDELHCR